MAWRSGERILGDFGVSGWRFNFEYMIKCQGLILVLYLSYLSGKSHFLASRKQGPFKSVNWDFAKVHQIGKRLIIIGVASHVLWFSYSLLIVGTEFGRKLVTIPGITTLTQVLPVGVTCMYLAQKKNNILKWHKWLAISIVSVTLRSILNSERLALLELFIPLSVIYLYFYQGKKLKQKFILVVGAFLGAYLLFFTFEYLRSWQFYKYRWDGSYSSFINDRIGLYYLSSWNNGVVYSQYWQDVTGGGRAFFAFITEFPLFQTIFGGIIADGAVFEQWYYTLNATVGTAEFNNPNYLIISFTDLTYAGAIFWFVLVGILIGKLVKEAQRNNLMALLSYACTVIALADLPRVGWWTATRSVPVYLALAFVYFSKLDQDQSATSAIK
jgi:oligosaccharide repeat unit polymerase